MVTGAAKRGWSYNSRVNFTLGVLMFNKCMKTEVTRVVSYSEVHESVIGTPDHHYFMSDLVNNLYRTSGNARGLFLQM